MENGRRVRWCRLGGPAGLGLFGRGRGRNGWDLPDSLGTPCLPRLLGSLPANLSKCGLMPRRLALLGEGSFPSRQPSFASKSRLLRRRQIFRCHSLCLLVKKCRHCPSAFARHSSTAASGKQIIQFRTRRGFTAAGIALAGGSLGAVHRSGCGVASWEAVRKILRASRQLAFNGVKISHGLHKE